MKPRWHIVRYIVSDEAEPVIVTSTFFKWKALRLTKKMNNIVLPWAFYTAQRSTDADNSSRQS